MDGSRRARRSRTAPRLALAVTLLLVGSMTGVAAADDEPAKPAVYWQGEWFLRDTLTGGPATNTFRYGSDDGLHIHPMLCDWNADGTETPGLRRRQPDGANPVWHLRDSNTGGVADHAFVYGREADVAICGDWNGNGQQTPGVVRKHENGLFEWHLRNDLAGGGADVSFVYGRDDRPGEEFPPVHTIVGDWNGNGVDTPGLARGRDDGRFEWLLRNDTAGGPADLRYVYYGGAVWGDPMHVSVPVVGDFNGDGMDTAGVVRTIDMGSYRWFLRHEHAGGPADHQFSYGRNLPDYALVWK